MIAGGALFGVLLLCLISIKNHPVEVGRPELDQAKIHVGDKIIPVTIADTQPLRSQGLSGTPSLKTGTGKLFIFPKTAIQGFWMKDMQYPIDIVWIDEAWKVIGITEHVDPASYPTIFYAPAPVPYVLEINAGEAAVDNFGVGVQLRLEK